jgi:hypothetical protein
VSFVGFVPSRNPEFTIAVVVDTPRGVPAYGGTVAVPIFKRIADAALRHRGVPPSIDPYPPVLVARHDDEDEVRERPASGPAQPPAIVTMPGGSGAAAGFPDLTGMSARDAIRVLTRLGVRPALHGAGLVTSQRPAAGTRIESGVTATLWLRRRQPVETVSSTRP